MEWAESCPETFVGNFSCQGRGRNLRTLICCSVRSAHSFGQLLEEMKASYVNAMALKARKVRTFWDRDKSLFVGKRGKTLSENHSSPSLMEQTRER